MATALYSRRELTHLPGLQKGILFAITVVVTPALLVCCTTFFITIMSYEIWEAPEGSYLLRRWTLLVFVTATFPHETSSIPGYMLLQVCLAPSLKCVKVGWKVKRIASQNKSNRELCRILTEQAI